MYTMIKYLLFFVLFLSLKQNITMQLLFLLVSNFQAISIDTLPVCHITKNYFKLILIKLYLKMFRLVIPQFGHKVIVKENIFKCHQTFNSIQIHPTLPKFLENIIFKSFNSRPKTINSIFLISSYVNIYVFLRYYLITIKKLYYFKLIVKI